MQSSFDTQNKIHYIKLEPGEDIIPSLTNYCEKKSINSGFLHGIGAVKKAVLGFFDIEKKEYKKLFFNFNAEILNCTGNITKKSSTDEYILHCHVQIGDKNGKVFGGHLFEDTPISVTGEFIIFETQLNIKRSKDDRFNLFLLNLS